MNNACCHRKMHISVYTVAIYSELFTLLSEVVVILHEVLLYCSVGNPLKLARSKETSGRHSWRGVVIPL